MLLSLQFSAGPPTQAPPEQVSLVVQALASSQAAVLFVCTQPVDMLHESSVHGLLSLQLGVGPPAQTPPEQVSVVLQALLSLQAGVLLTCRHPMTASHESFVQTLLSSQLSGVPAVQTPD